MSVLVVDDNTMLLSKIVRSLVRANTEVRSATSIQAARELMRIKLPEVLCLDVQLPDGNGLDWLQTLREQAIDVPVVIISGHHSEDSRTRAAELGAAGFLAKPFALSELHALLKSYLSPEQSLDEETGRDSADHTGNGTNQRTTHTLQNGRLARAKRAYSTRHSSLSRATQLIVERYQPKAGDLVLARVDKLNQHARLELTDGRRAVLYPGDEILVCYGNRYAPDQFEAEVPGELMPCHLVAAGGIAAEVRSRNSKVRAATRITPIGVLADEHREAINLAHFSSPASPLSTKRPPITAVVGTSMNAGKTTTLANLALGMARQGLKVGSAKVTGTGAGCDLWQMTDAGCRLSLDFTHAGVPSTYKLSLTECERILEYLVARLCEQQLDHILIEVADGVLQKETQELVTSSTFARLVDNVLFAAGDALGAAAGVSWLQQRGIEVIAVSGALTAAPLAMRECAELMSLPILSPSDLNGGTVLLGSAPVKRNVRIA